MLGLTVGTFGSRTKAPNRETSGHPWLGRSRNALMRSRKPSACRNPSSTSLIRLDTRVRISMGKAKGKISVEFASLGDLERNVGIIDPRNRDDRPI